MPVQEFFAEQLEHMKRFMEDPKQTLRCVHVDPDMKAVLRKMLAGLDHDATVPHILIPSDAAFANRDKFYDAVLADLSQSYAASAPALKEVGVMEAFTVADLRREKPEKRIPMYLCSMSEGLPDHIGSLVVILDPQSVSDAIGYRQSLAAIVENTWSKWVKYLVIDDRTKPNTVGLEELSKKVGRQTFYLPPDEMEKRIAQAVSTDFRLSLRERGQYTGMLAGFALARRDHAAALKAYEDQLALVRLRKVPTEEAPVLYSLGNVHQSSGDYVAAEAAYGEALGIVIDHKLDALRPLVLTQLAVNLAAQGRTEQAEKSFTLARGASQNVNSPPTEAYTLDCQAQCFVKAKQHAEAERCWKEALAAYESITSDAMQDVRNSGRADIRHKLEHFYRDTKQTAKLAALTAGGRS